MAFKYCIHMAPFSLISQRPLSSEHDQSQQPNMLAYGRFFFKSLKFIFCLNEKHIHPTYVITSSFIGALMSH